MSRIEKRNVTADIFIDILYYYESTHIARKMKYREWGRFATSTLKPGCILRGSFCEITMPQINVVHFSFEMGEFLSNYTIAVPIESLSDREPYKDSREKIVEEINRLIRENNPYKNVRGDAFLFEHRYQNQQRGSWRENHVYVRLIDFDGYFLIFNPQEAIKITELVHLSTDDHGNGNKE